MDAPGGVAQAATQFAGDADDGVDDEGAAAVGLVAVDGADQTDPRGLDEVLAADPAAVAKAGGQPLGKAQVGQDDPFADGGVPGGVPVLEPLLDLRDGVLVAWADVRGKGRRDGHSHRLSSMAAWLRPDLPKLTEGAPLRIHTVISPGQWPRACMTAMA